MRKIVFDQIYIAYIEKQLKISFSETMIHLKTRIKILHESERYKISLPPYQKEELKWTISCYDKHKHLLAFI